VRGVPPGKYTVIAWREGGAEGTTQTMEVTVPSGGAGKADFAFGAAATQLNTSLKVMPALELPVLHH